MVRVNDIMETPKRCGMTIIVQLLLLGISTLPVWAQGKGWEKQWDEILAAARKEGRVVVAASPHETVRRMLPAAFKKRFGITLEYLGGRSSGTAGRLRAERRAKVYTIDAMFGGATTMVNILYAEKMIDPVKPMLILPEVLDPSKWKKGKLWFIDPGEKYILRVFNTVSANLYINTDHVNPKEIQSFKDLLNPKWKGKIAVLDPRQSNTGALFYHNFGEEFVKQFYIGQKAVFTRSRRQLADWLARGTYPISTDVGRGDVKRFKDEGFPVAIVYNLPGLPSRVTAGNGLVALLNKAPHPNAARVFLNWIASKEGIGVLSRGYLYPTTRNDVDESFIPAEQIPRSGVEYFDGQGWEWAVTKKKQALLRIRELLRSR